MTTNSSERSERTPQAYGERPGLTTREPEPVGPVRLAACLSAVRNGVTLSPLTMFDVCHALEDARAEAARLRAALERVDSYLSPMPAEGNMAAAVAFGMVRAALRATEAGKDGAK